MAKKPPAAQTNEPTTNNATPSPEDELFAEAKAIVVDEQRASVSFLQRRLTIGYTRASLLIEKLEAAGIVGPSQVNSNIRQVLKAREMGEYIIEQYRTIENLDYSGWEAVSDAGFNDTASAVKWIAENNLSGQFRIIVVKWQNTVKHVRQASNEK